MKFLLLLLTFFSLGLTALADAPSAMITHLEGPAIVIVNGVKSSAAPMLPLNDRTLVELRGDTKMTVVFFDQDTQEQYSGPALIGIGKTRGKVFHGAETSRQVTATNSALVKAIDPNSLSKVSKVGSATPLSAASAQTVASAQAEADQMAAKNPGDTTPHVMMFSLYNQLGQTAKAGAALTPALAAQPSEDAFISRMNAMGQQVDKQADKDTAYAQGFYQSEENWGLDSYYDPEAWGWEGW